MITKQSDGARRIKVIMLCKECNADVGYSPGKGIKSVICWRCIAKIVAAPETPRVIKKLTTEERSSKKEEREKKKIEKLNSAKKGRLRGWHKKKLFEHDGRFYSYGNPVSDADAMKIKKELQKESENQ